MTAVAYVPGAVVGYFLLDGGVLDSFHVGTSPALTSLTDRLFGWAVDLLAGFLPGWMLFPVGVGVLLAGFTLFDRVLPTVGSHQLEGRDNAWYTRRWPMFSSAWASPC